MHDFTIEAGSLLNLVVDETLLLDMQGDVTPTSARHTASILIFLYQRMKLCLYLQKSKCYSNVNRHIGLFDHIYVIVIFTMRVRHDYARYVFSQSMKQEANIMLNMRSDSFYFEAIDTAETWREAYLRLLRNREYT